MAENKSVAGLLGQLVGFLIAILIIWGIIKLFSKSKTKSRCDCPKMLYDNGEAGFPKNPKALDIFVFCGQTYMYSGDEWAAEGEGKASFFC